MMNFAKKKKSSVEFLFVLMLLAVFAVSAMLVVVFGAKVFRKTTGDMDDNYDRRIAYFYIEEKLRACDKADMIDISDDGDMLILHLKGDTNDYITYIYCYDGYLKEQTLPSDAELIKDKGNDIVQAYGFECCFSGSNLLKVAVTPASGNEMSFVSRVECNGGGNDEIQ